MLTKEEHAALLRSFAVDRLLQLVTLEAKRLHDGHGLTERKLRQHPIWLPEQQKWPNQAVERLLSYGFRLSHTSEVRI